MKTIFDLYLDSLRSLGSYYHELTKTKKELKRQNRFLVAAMVLCVSGITYCLYELYWLLK